MSYSFWYAFPVVVIAGAAVALQAPINASLGRSLDSTIAAAAISFGVGFAVLLLLAFITGGAAVFSPLAGVAWWQLIGGMIGAYYVWATLWGVPTLGVLTTVAALILGQMVAALLLDTFGPLGLPVRELSAARIAAIVLVSSGLVLSRF
ncbi:MAG: DMT family transporter [Rhodobacterales bacterium]